MSVYDKYETVVGLETHVQLSTKSKAFCGDDASYGGDPNTHISTISLGHPGTLPRLNEKQVEFAIRLGLALGCWINNENYFDRKNYFYADLPKGYQITQDKRPICVGGSLEIEAKGLRKRIRIHHVHMEEDAGKSIHDLDPNYSYIDLNRAGVPLLEIVSEPDLRSAEEAASFMTAMRQLVRYLGISDGNMEQGSLRCDCNVSVRLKGEETYGDRCEIKNVNSMRFARRAIEYEAKRQIDLIEAGGKVVQTTLNFDPATGRTSPLREKEYAHDYRYFPEPDLPPIVLNQAYIDRIKQALPALPWELTIQFHTTYKLPLYDARLLTEEQDTALYFLELVKHTTQYKAASNLLINKILPFVAEQKVSLAEFPLSFESIANFIQLIKEGKVSAAIAYQNIFPVLCEQPDRQAEAIARDLNLIKTDDTAFLKKLILEALAKYPDKVEAYKKGRKGLLGLFMGEVMRNSKGKADPKTTTDLLKKMLEA